MAVAEVWRSGIYSTIQDSGRKEYMHLGVPVSGVLDKEAGALANFLVGNDSDAALIEMTVQGLTLRFDDAAIVAFAGATTNIYLDNVFKRANTPFKILPGQELQIGTFSNRWRGYLAIRGGWQTTTLLGSRSALPALGLAPLKKNDRIPFLPLDDGEFSEVYFYPKTLNRECVLQLFPGPEFDLLSEDFTNFIHTVDFSISSKSNRMATILEEPIPVLNCKKEIISSAVFPGIVQLYPNGQLGIIMYDGQVTGGYPRVAYTNEDGMNLLAQMRPGEKVSLKITPV